MNKLIISFLFACCLYSIISYGLIVESNSITDILRYATTDTTLFVFDLDDTLVQCEGGLSQQWVDHVRDQKIHQGTNQNQAMSETLALWLCLLQHIELEPVEGNTTLEILRQLRTKNINIIALTSRSLSVADRTLQQLEHIGIAFNPAFVAEPQLMFDMCLYKNGVLFVEGKDKGTALLKLLYLTHFYPTQIIFVDDRLTHVESVESALMDLIPFVGIHYTFAASHQKSTVSESEKFAQQYMTYCPA